MRALVALVLAAVLGILAPAAGAAPPRVTVLGDSVQASFEFAPQATRALGRGLDLRVDARVCRRLVRPSCSHQGVTPATALQVVRRRRSALGRVVVVNVGYNDAPSGYDVQAVLAALRASGVRGVVWVTLRDVRPGYGAINASIRAAAARAPWVRVADWNAHSAGRSWFGSDGLHLSPAGASGLAALLREHVLDALAAEGAATPAGPPARRVRAPLPVARLAGDGVRLWIAGGGRLAALDARSGRTAVPGRPLAGAALMADGRGAWVRSRADGGLRPPGDPAVPALARVAPGTRLALAGAGLWAATLCAPPWTPCPSAAELAALDPGTGAVGTTVALARLPSLMAADGGDLWTLAVTDAPRARLERRDAVTGALRRVVVLPAGRVRALAASSGAAWVVRSGGRLLRVPAGGTPRPVPGGAVALAADGDEVWALRPDRRSLARLDPGSGRAATVSALGRRLSAPVVALAGGGVWLADRGDRGVLRVPRP